MNRHTTLVLSTVALLLCLGVALPGAFAQQSPSGTAADAMAMLERAVAAVKANPVPALEMFNAGEGGFLDRDIYPFCFQLSDGKTVATQIKPRLGEDVRTFKDPTGKAFGEELYKAGTQDGITEVDYMFPRPGTDIPVQTVSFVTRAGDLGCGVGYYK
jgi:hypothetical protein